MKKYFLTKLTLILIFSFLAACSVDQTDAIPQDTLVETETEQPEISPENAFKNPVLRQNFPDPFILSFDGTYYAYATNGAGKNVQYATSTDLVDWKLEGDAMPSLAAWVQLNRSDVWAPEVMQVGDNFLLYYTARDKESGRQCVGLATSDNPAGKFKDSNTEPLVCQTDEGGTIDASPFVDGDKRYLLYKNDGNCCGYPTYIYIQELSPDGLSLVGESTRLIRNEKQWEAHVIEAPTMVKHEDKFYLFYSANNYAGHEYAVGYAICESTMGPCEKAPENPILSSKLDDDPMIIGPGHQSIYQKGDQTWIFYHVWDILPSGIRGDNRMMWMDRLDWIDGQPVIQGPTTGPQSKP